MSKSRRIALLAVLLTLALASSCRTYNPPPHPSEDPVPAGHSRIYFYNVSRQPKAIYVNDVLVADLGPKSYAPVLLEVGANSIAVTAGPSRHRLFERDQRFRITRREADLSEGVTYYLQLRVDNGSIEPGQTSIRSRHLVDAMREMAYLELSPTP